MVHGVCYRERQGKRYAVHESNYVHSTLLKRFKVADFSGIPALVSTDLGPVKQEESMVNSPYRYAVEGPTRQ